MTTPFARIPEILSGPLPYREKAHALCAYLRGTFAHYSWIGIYMIEEEGALVLAAWDGPQPTRHARIRVGEGICGLAAEEGRSVVVVDVNADPRYLPCFPSTRSEIVVPIWKDGRVIGEIDVDGDKARAYNDLDRIFLEWCASLLAEAYG